uniref:Uncharacterized protein n=1 Tax=Trypanosoma congolense (strain IL3000) TaxID=1068625 RepID=G0UM77_TRYCI|nr:hypothetical protein, unlikely [Trypanosoma congolense IL3000]
MVSCVKGRGGRKMQNNKRMCVMESVYKATLKDAIKGKRKKAHQASICRGTNQMNPTPVHKHSCEIAVIFTFAMHNLATARIALSQHQQQKDNNAAIYVQRLISTGATQQGPVHETQQNK